MDNNQFKNKEQELPENQTVWKSDSQRVKETFIQTGALRQRNMTQMKEQIKTPEKELSDKEIDNLSDAVFKPLVIRMLIELTSLVEGRNESYPK